MRHRLKIKSSSSVVTAPSSEAQGTRHRPPKPGIAGSNPVGGVCFWSLYYFVTVKEYNFVICDQYIDVWHKITQGK